MKKKAPNEYDDDNPWEGDRLERQSVGVYLTELISSIEQPFVIALKSEFGTGKTDFLQRWKRHLNNSDKSKFKAVYFNAWETDYASEPLVALISQIVPEITSKKNDLLDALDAMVMYSFGATLSGVVDFVDPTGAIKKAAQTSREIAQSASKEKLDQKKYGKFKQRFEEFEATEKAIDQFRKALSTALYDSNKSKLIILIDELDRCRPTYAIEVLECIKHLFNISGIIFVIAVDNEQLQNAVSSVYGSKLDGDGYLRKFFDWQLNLPKPSAKQYTRYLIDKFDLSSFFKEDENLSQYVYADFNSKESFIKVFSAFSEICGLSLRKQEQCFTTLDLILRNSSNKFIITSYLGFVLAVYAYKTDRHEFERFCLYTNISKDDSFNYHNTKEHVFSDPKNRAIVEKIFDPKKLSYDIFKDYLFANLRNINQARDELNNERLNYNYLSLEDRIRYDYKCRFLENITNVLRDNPKDSTVAHHLYKKIEKAASLLDD